VQRPRRYDPLPHRQDEHRAATSRRRAQVGSDRDRHRDGTHRAEADEHPSPNSKPKPGATAVRSVPTTTVEIRANSSACDSSGRRCDRSGSTGWPRDRERESLDETH
jgi:hypothetical protein